jgi:predicted metalloprotease with PDZ domain
MKKTLSAFFAIALGLLSTSAFAQKISYEVAVPEPHTHYCEVKVTVEDAKKKHIDFTLPTWAPGSYLIREFSKNVEQENAVDATGKPLKVEKVTKNTWRVHTNNSNKVTFSYKVYAFELSVRTSFIDASHAFLSSSSIFVFPVEMEKLPSTLTVKPHSSWKQISTGLSPVGNDKFVLAVPNYDILADSPIELGNQDILTFTAAGVRHEVAFWGGGNYDPASITKHMAKIVEETTSIFGENPNTQKPFDHYTFIVHNPSRGGGGLEHLNSTVLQNSRWGYGGSGLTNFLSLVAHEYFHLWNVKRLRPKPLGGFDYSNENYTRMLWFAEGVTSYYDNLITRRAGYIEENKYIDEIINTMSNHENSAGSKVQSIGEASFDAWIKFYRPNENSKNSTVSYYTSGAMVGALLDLEIMGATEGKKCLDDVMRYMYQEYYKKLDRGYTEEELQKACELIAGKPLTIFKHIYSTTPIDYEYYLSFAGIKLQKVTDARTPSLGTNLADEDGKIIVKSVAKGTAGYDGGLNVNDEIIAIDGHRMPSASFTNSYVAGQDVGQEIEVLVSRDNLIIPLKIKLAPEGKIGFRFVRNSNATATQELIFKKWTGSKM